MRVQLEAQWLVTGRSVACAWAATRSEHASQTQRPLLSLTPWAEDQLLCWKGRDEVKALAGGCCLFVALPWAGCVLLA